MTYLDVESAAPTLPLAKRRGAVRQTNRQRRLTRLAEILDEHDRIVPLLTRMEYAPWEERPYLREDRSPLTLAFEDLGFRREGLSGDRLGDIMDFFEIDDREAHHLLCYCHYSGSVTSKMVASRARELARRKTFAQMWRAFRLRLFGAA